MLKRNWIIEISRKLMNENSFKDKHRATKEAFTRARKLPFELVLVMILRKSVKSLQNVVNEAMFWLETEAVTASAFCQARYKLLHTAFIELNQKAIVEPMYSDKDYLTFWGYRVLGVDGSKVILPNNQETREEFGAIPYTNGKNKHTLGEHCYGTASVLYDVMNRIAIDAVLASGKAYEVDLAIAHLQHTTANDLCLMDRNYPSYLMMAEFSQRQRSFVIRCSAQSFTVARQLAKGTGIESRVVTIKVPRSQLAEVRKRGLPESITVRFVRVMLKTGEAEVLATSLVDECAYPSADFAELYRLRWGVETFYGLLKTRLGLENFSGQSVEAIKQDFYATIYLTGIEAVLTDAAQKQLDDRDTRHPQIVNRAVSFNVIKNHALDLLLSDLDSETLTEKLTKLFLKNPVSRRIERNPPRKKSSPRVLLNFQRRKKKHCF
jgi:hypothetical protein